MNRINPAKLLHSKWTAVSPVKREKHFMVVEVERDEEGVVLSSAGGGADQKSVQDGLA